MENYRARATADDSQPRIAAIQSKADLVREQKRNLLGSDTAGQLSGKDPPAINREHGRETAKIAQQIETPKERHLNKTRSQKARRPPVQALREAKRDAVQIIASRVFAGKYIGKFFVTPEEC